MNKKNIVETKKEIIDYESPNLKEFRKINSEQEILVRLEEDLKHLIQIKKRLKIDFQAQIQKVNEWFKKEWQKITRFENKMILSWDFYQREVEILALKRQLEDKNLSIEQREEITKKKDNLTLINVSLEQGYREKKVDEEMLAELRKKLGAWEE